MTAKLLIAREVVLDGANIAVESGQPFGALD
jgi:hypothetical protein